MVNMVSPQQRPCGKTMMYAAVMLATLSIDGFGLVSAKHISSNTSNIGINIEDGEAMPRQLHIIGDPKISITDPTANTGFAKGDTDVASYVQACKCDSAQSFKCNTEALVANKELFVCIKSIQSSEVEIDYLDSLNVIQGSNALKVIEVNAVSIPSITSREYVPNKDGVVVGTRVPSNIFTHATDESITITGVVVMKLAGGGSRRVQFATSDNAFMKVW